MVYFGPGRSGSNRVGFYFRLLFALSTELTVRRRGMSVREEEKKQGMKRKNDDVSSALNHGGFKEELSC